MVMDRDTIFIHVGTTPILPKWEPYEKIWENETYTVVKSLRLIDDRAISFEIGPKRIALHKPRNNEKTSLTKHEFLDEMRKLFPVDDFPELTEAIRRSSHLTADEIIDGIKTLLMSYVPPEYRTSCSVNETLIELICETLCMKCDVLGHRYDSHEYVCDVCGCGYDDRKT